jgi:hypothetical protein
MTRTRLSIEFLMRFKCKDSYIDLEGAVVQIYRCSRERSFAGWGESELSLSHFHF